MPAYFFSKNIRKKSIEIFKKVLDKMLFMWYNIYAIKRSPKGKDKRSTSWIRILNWKKKPAM